MYYCDEKLLLMYTVNLQDVRSKGSQGDINIQGLPGAFLICTVDQVKDDPFHVYVWTTIQFYPGENKAEYSTQFGSIDCHVLAKYTISPAARRCLIQEHSESWGNTFAEHILAKSGTFKLVKDKKGEYCIELKIAGVTVYADVPDEIAPIE